MTAYTVLPRPEVGAATAWRFPDVTEHSLDNGLRVLTCHIAGKPLIAVSLLIDAPLDAESAGREGIGTITARTLTEGTERLDAEAFSDALERQGATLHADTGYDGLRTLLEVPGSRLEAGLALLAEAVLSPAFDASEVDRAVAERLDEVAVDRATPARRAEIELAAAVYAPTGRPSKPRGGTVESVGGLTREDVSAFYAAHHDPATATVVVAGDLAEVDVLALLGAQLGSWSSTGVKPHDAPPADRNPGRRVVIVDRPDAVQTQFAIGRPAPTRHAPDYAALDVAAYVLGGTLTSRIDTLLREEKGYTYGIRAVQRTERRHGTFVVYGSVDTENTAPAMADLLGVIEHAVHDGLTQDERDATSEYLAGVAPLRWETPRAIASHVTTLVGAGLGPAWTDSYLEAVRKVTTGQLDAALRQHVVPDDLTLVAVGNAEAITPALAQLGTPVVVPA